MRVVGKGNKGCIFKSLVKIQTAGLEGFFTEITVLLSVHSGGSLGITRMKGDLFSACSLSLAFLKVHKRVGSRIKILFLVKL